MKISLTLISVACVLLFSGCVEIEQELYVNHDGSGRFVETLTLTPRAIRLIKGQKARSKKGDLNSWILSKEASAVRLKSMKAMTLDKEKEVTLPDGRKQIEVSYTFKDVRKIQLWMPPSLSYKGSDSSSQWKNCGGELNFKYIKELKVPKENKLFRDRLVVINRNSRQMPAEAPMSPVAREEFNRVLPVFVDMMKDFKLSLTVIAPIEDFEENNMIQGLKNDKNRVTIFHVEGKDFSGAGAGFIQQMMMNEVSPGYLANHGNSIPGVFSTLPFRHHGYSMMFMKVKQLIASDYNMPEKPTKGKKKSSVKKRSKKKTEKAKKVKEIKAPKKTKKVKEPKKDAE